MFEIMQRLVIVLSLFLLFNLSFAQEKAKHFEFGSTLVTVNSFSQTAYEDIFLHDRPLFEFINGLFFRYTKKRFSFRVLTSYSDNYMSYKAPTTGCADCESGDSHNKDFRIGIGGQFAIIKKGWFYIFSDISYRKLVSAGSYTGGIGGWNNSFINESNGIESLTGFGSRIVLFKLLCLSPELGYNYSYKSVNSSTTSNRTGEKNNSSYTRSLTNPILKLHLTLLF